jgi:hypothetical protein
MQNLFVVAGGALTQGGGEGQRRLTDSLYVVEAFIPDR